MQRAQQQDQCWEGRGRTASWRPGLRGATLPGPCGSGDAHLLGKQQPPPHVRTQGKDDGQGRSPPAGVATLFLIKDRWYFSSFMGPTLEMSCLSNKLDKLP